MGGQTCANDERLTEDASDAFARPAFSVESVEHEDAHPREFSGDTTGFEKTKRCVLRLVRHRAMSPCASVCGLSRSMLYGLSGR